MTSLHAIPMTIVCNVKNAVRQAFHRIADRRRRRRDQRRHENLLRLAAEYTIPAFLMPDDPQLPPKPPSEKGAAPSSYPARLVRVAPNHLVWIPASHPSDDDPPG